MSGRRRASSEGRLTGRSRRRHEILQLEIRRRPVARRLADEHGERVPRHAQLLAQRRHQRLILRELALGTQQVHSRHRAFIQRLAHEIDVARVLVEDASAARIRARAEAIANACSTTLPVQRKMRGGQLVLLHFRERALLFDGALHAAGVVRACS